MNNWDDFRKVHQSYTFSNNSKDETVTEGSNTSKFKSSKFSYGYITFLKDWNSKHLKSNLLRSSHPEVFCKKDFAIFAKFTCARVSFLIKLKYDFLKLGKQRVVLNGQQSSWSNIETGVPQGAILGRLLFLIYINDLSDSLTTNARPLANDVSLFSLADNINLSATYLNSDLTLSWRRPLSYRNQS